MRANPSLGRVWRIAGLIALTLFVLGAPRHGFSQNDRRYLVLSTSGVQPLASQLLEGCKIGAIEIGGATCELAPLTSDIAKNLNSIEDFLRSEGSGIILQAYFAEPVYTTSIQRARDAGVLTVVASTSTIEAVSALAESAVSVVGISAASIAQNIKNVAATTAAKNDAFCILAIKDDPVSFSLLNQLLAAQLGEAGLTPSSSCPPSLEFKTTYDETLRSAALEILKNDKVKIFVLPVGTLPDTLAALNEIAVQEKSDTVFLSAAVNPMELGHVAINTLYKAVQGEKVESPQELAPVIHISTDKFCEACDCEKDSTCKSSCKKCN